MITVEYSAKEALITILDKTGRTPDLQIIFEQNADIMFLRQTAEDADSSDVISLNTDQATSLLKALLAMADNND